MKFESYGSLSGDSLRDWHHTVASTGMLPCGFVAGSAHVVTNRDRTECQWHSRGWVVIPWVCPSPSGPQWGHSGGALGVQVLAGGTDGSAPGTEWHSWTWAGQHSWLWPGHWAAQLALHHTPGGTAGCALDAGQHSWLGTTCWVAQLFYTGCCVAQLALHLPLPDLSQGTKCPGLLSVATAAAGMCWGMAAGHQWIFSADLTSAFTQMLFQIAFHLS